MINQIDILEFELDIDDAIVINFLENEKILYSLDFYVSSFPNCCSYLIYNEFRLVKGDLRVQSDLHSEYEKLKFSNCLSEIIQKLSPKCKVTGREYLNHGLTAIMAIPTHPEKDFHPDLLKILYKIFNKKPKLISKAKSGHGNYFNIMYSISGDK